MPDTQFTDAITGFAPSCVFPSVCTCASITLCPDACHLVSGATSHPQIRVHVCLPEEIASYTYTQLNFIIVLNGLELVHFMMAA